MKENNLRLFRTLNWYWIFVAFYFFYSKQILILAWKTNFLGDHYLPLVNFLLDYNPLIIFCLYLIALILFVWSLEGESLKYQIQQLAWTICCLLLVVGQSHFTIANLYEGFIWLIIPHGLIIVNDIMAYYFGIVFGRKIVNRPLTHLSPNKTWEGFIGAMFSTLCFAFFISPYLLKIDWFICSAQDYQPVIGCQHSSTFVQQTYTIPHDIRDMIHGIGIHIPSTLTLYPFQFHAFFFGLFASLVAPFGGFLASGIKRAYQVKDYAALFPGHGGFMDRVDCQFMMSSFVYVYLITIVLPSQSSVVNSIISQASSLGYEDRLKILEALSLSLKQSPL